MIIFELYYCKMQFHVQDDGMDLQALKELVIAIESRLEVWYGQSFINQLYLRHANLGHYVGK